MIKLIIPNAIPYTDIPESARLLSYREFQQLPPNALTHLNIVGPFWLSTKISCQVQAVGIIQPDGTVIEGRYPKHLQAYVVVKND